MKNKLTFILLSLLSLASEAQVLPAQPLRDTLHQPLDLPLAERLNSLDQTLLRQTRQQLLQDQLATEKLRQQLRQNLDPVIQLPSRLAVLNKQNQLLWRETELSPGVRVVEGQWLLLLSAQQWQQQRQLHRYLMDQKHYAELGLTLYRIQLPEGAGSKPELFQSLPAQIQTQIFSNTIYSPQQGEAAATSKIAAPGHACQRAVKIGMVDSAVDRLHPAFVRPEALISKNFLPADISQSTQHGTAVASLLMGQGPQLQPLVPDAQLYSAEVFYQQNAYQQGATLVHLLEALDWLASQQVQLINLSLTGPAHPLLHHAIKALTEKHMVLVAAAGNAGPAAEPLYPAAYEEVIAVTAVDQQQHIYRWANQGHYIDFAASGVAVTVAKAGAAFGLESGTSLASPVVAAIAACHLAAGIPATDVRAWLQQQATDLGEPGKDSVYGFGQLSPSSN